MCGANVSYYCLKTNSSGFLFSVAVISFSVAVIVIRLRYIYGGPPHRNQHRLYCICARPLRLSSSSGGGSCIEARRNFWRELRVGEGCVIVTATR